MVASYAHFVMIDWRRRVVIDPSVRGGDAVIRGTRIQVSTIVACLASGDDVAKIVSDHPQLQPADIQAALAYAAEVLQQERPIPIG
jgi:uncharacterized protein (DUF433 family)